MTEKATPARWTMTEQSSTNLFDGKTRTAFHVELPDGRKVLCPDEATAELIVKAVNSHQSLMDQVSDLQRRRMEESAQSEAVIKELVYTIKDLLNHNMEYENGDVHIADPEKAKAVIAKADSLLAASEVESRIKSEIEKVRK